MTPPEAEIAQAPVRHLTETGSTNEDALGLVRAGEAGPFWIRADRQRQGRGRQGRVWDSPAGNLYCSLLLPVAADPRALPQVAHVAAVALAEAVEDTVGAVRDLRIKWPNDLLVGDAKVSGILVEATRTAAGRQFCIIGCGVNCASFPEGLPYRATALSAVTGTSVAPSRLFDALRSRLAAAWTTWDGGAGFPAIRTRWLARALRLDTPLTVRAGREPVHGRFQGIDDEGRLLLLGPDGPLTVEAGDVILDEKATAAGGRIW